MRDDRLAARAGKGDRSAFAELYGRHHQALFRYCLALLAHPEDAADALQTTMAKALVALESGESVKGVRPWLFRIAHNTALDLIRRRRPHADLDALSEAQSSSLTVPSAASEAEDRADLAQAVSDIRGLPDRQRSALVMRELSALSYAEIAAALETSEPAARQLVHGARKGLHETRRGRGMDCDDVRRGLGDADGKTPRDRRMRAHLAACSGCRSFQESITTRRSALAALAPPLAPAAASEILARLLESGSGVGAGLATGGGVAAGGLAKIAGAATSTKVAAAVVGTAAVAAAGGLVAAGGGLVGDEKTAASGSGVPSFLREGLPGLRPLPRPPADARAERRGPRPSATPSAPPVVDSAGPALAQSTLDRRGPVSEEALSAPEPGRPPVTAGDSGPAGPDEGPVGGVAQVELPDSGSTGLPDLDGSSVDAPDLGGDLPDLNLGLPGNGGGSGSPVEPPGGGGFPPMDNPPVRFPDNGWVPFPGGGGDGPRGGGINFGGSGNNSPGRGNDSRGGNDSGGGRQGIRLSSP